MRVGTGFDAHRFDSDRPLIIGGVTIPAEFGLAGHSDADVACHALIDAILGAMAAGDIGGHFPDSDDRFKDAHSLELLDRTGRTLAKAGFELVNLDLTIILEEPKLAPWIKKIRSNIAGALKIQVNKVSVKATTTEGLGFTGRREGAAAQAVVLIEETAESRHH